MTSSTTNNDGWYTVDCGPFRHKLPVRYQKPVCIGEGAYGAVIRAKDTVTGKYVAIKKDAQTLSMFNICTTNVSGTETVNVSKSPRRSSCAVIQYFVLNYAGITLDKAIEERKVYSEDYVKLIIYSLLRGLKFMHSAGVIHRDLKPENIGIDSNVNITILDFGLARVASSGVQTGDVCTRWWRAPEIYLNRERYNEKVDIWSVGCIMAELILLEPVFRGSDDIDQLNKIFDILGTPDPAILAEICTPEGLASIRTLPAKSKQDYNKLFGYKDEAESETPTARVSPQGVTLLDRLLSFDYRLRPTAEEALADEFFESLHDPKDEPTTDRLIDEHGDVTYTVEEWKSIIWQMVKQFQPPSWIDDEPR